VRLFQAAGVRPILLDGDELRAVLGIEGAYDIESRHRIAYIYARLCHRLAAQGHVVICATIALFHDVHAWNRANMPNYVEVFLEVPLVELQRRDSKGIYQAPSGEHETWGVGIAAEFPEQPDVWIANYGSTTAEAAAQAIFDRCSM